MSHEKYYFFLVELILNCEHAYICKFPSKTVFICICYQDFLIWKISSKFVKVMRFITYFLIIINIVDIVLIYNLCVSSVVESTKTCHSPATSKYSWKCVLKKKSDSFTEYNNKNCEYFIYSICCYTFSSLSNISIWSFPRPNISHTMLIYFKNSFVIFLFVTLTTRSIF